MAVEAFDVAPGSSKCDHACSEPGCFEFDCFNETAAQSSAARPGLQGDHAQGHAQPALPVGERATDNPSPGLDDKHQPLILGEATRKVLEAAALVGQVGLELLPHEVECADQFVRGGNRPDGVASWAIRW